MRRVLVNSVALWIQKAYAVYNFNSVYWELISFGKRGRPGSRKKRNINRYQLSQEQLRESSDTQISKINYINIGNEMDSWEAAWSDISASLG